MEKTEVSGSATWTEFITSWFTPKIIFCALNIMIGTIFVSSNLKSHRTKKQDINNDHEHHHNFNHYPFQLIRPPSLLQRVRSFDFSLFPSSHHDPHPHPLEQSPSLLQRVKSIKLTRLYSSTSSPAAAAAQTTTNLTEPEQSQTVAADDHNDVAVPIKSDRDVGRVLSEKKLKKSESMKEIAAGKVTHDDEGDQIPRPATTREGNKTTSLGVDNEVDAKADDFISRFREQLKLQRLESLIRYKEMLKRGGSSKY